MPPSKQRLRLSENRLQLKPKLLKLKILKIRRKQMLQIRYFVLPTLLLVTSCATPVPVAVLCPPQRPVPQNLTEPLSVGPSLTERYNNLMQEFQVSLKKAIKD